MSVLTEAQVRRDNPHMDGNLRFSGVLSTGKERPTHHLIVEGDSIPYHRVARADYYFDPVAGRWYLGAN
jgi:hypothetical protein